MDNFLHSGSRRFILARALFIASIVFLCALLALAASNSKKTADPAPAPQNGALLFSQSEAAVAQKSTGCISCHTTTDSASMHPTDTVHIGCADCHLGDASVTLHGEAPKSAAYEKLKLAAHVKPRYAENAVRFRAPIRAYTDWLEESRDFIQFVNPGDLRVAERTCGTYGCHTQEVHNVRTSMMTHGAMLWEAGLYNNGGIPYKNAKFGESYGPNGEPQRIRTWPPPTPEEIKTKGVLPFLDPIQRWEISQPGNLLRAFERGGEKRPELGIPSPEEDPGRPDIKLGDRGIGTELRTDPVFLGLQKTRLLDPLLSFPGTNDHPGDYRGSGCTGCHVVYANDLDPEHSAQYAKYGHSGTSASVDPTIDKSESGHPIKHILTRSIPSSSCMVCHVHPGTNMETTYFGYTFWDNEVDGKDMYPAKQKNPTAKQIKAVELADPEGSAVKGNWSDLNFLKNIYTNVNPKTEYTKFADFHSHGWIFRAVFKRDRQGNMLDENGEIIDFKDPKKFEKSVQLKDIHLEKGMHCVDCHFQQDEHGNGKLYGETRNAIEIGCEDCHGTITQRATLKTSGPAAPDGGTNLGAGRTPFRELRFYWRANRLFQRSNLEQGKEWEVVQVLDTITPGNEHYSERSAYAKTVLKDGKTWGDLTKMHSPQDLAHSNSRMTCYTCHSSWTTSCFGCHLTMTANQKMPMLHNEGTASRNYTTYNFQVLRDDVYMLGIDGTVTGNRVAPVRSACAIVVSSQNANRDWIYYGQQPISTPGFSGEAFSTYVPHTVRATETKQCTDCHVSSTNNNNAWLAQIMLHGTNFLNYMGRFIYVAAGNDGYEAIPYVEQTEPNAVYGSDLQKLAYPANYKAFVAHGRQLKESYEHKGKVLDVQFRGEYLYTAMGEGGFRAFDIAQIDVKDFSERMTTAPVSPLGQRLYVKTKYATAIASPSTLAVDPNRTQIAENEEQKIHLIYGFLYVADKYEGLVVIGNKLDSKRLAGVGTLLDGDPRNNFLARAATFNPNGALNGARRITIIGVYAYMLCDKGLEVVDLDNPLKPKLVAEVPLHNPHGIDFQFRYAFITDADGMKVLDITHRDHPVLVPGALVPLPDARNVAVARTYAYVSAGKQGVAIINVERPDHPSKPTFFTANGALNDVNDFKISMTNSSQFGFVADGKNGMRVLQLFSPNDQPKFYGFSPEPTPRLIATRKMKGEALAISKGMDRDRAVDEDGNQIAVFGRRGARPFNKEELERLYLKDGNLYTVTDTPPGSVTAQHAGASATSGKR